MIDEENFDSAPESFETAHPVAVPRPAFELTSDPESYIISCCLLDEGKSFELAMEAGIRPQDFKDRRHQVIYGALKELENAEAPIALDTLVPQLNGRLESAGGIQYLLALTNWEAVGTTTRASYHINALAQAAAKAREIKRLKEQLQRVEERGVDAPPAGLQVGRRPLFSFPLIPDGHESILLGDRYLNRGDGAVLVSTSGMGKSSAAIQMATELALNLGPFGIQGNGPLRSLIIQSEDSDGDVAEVAYSLKHVLKLSDDQIKTVNNQVMVVTDRVNRGLRFISHLKKHIAEFKPDLVFINPLQAFMDGDVTESKDLGAFLREGLNSLNEPATFGYIIVHHTTKPSKPQAGQKSANWNEVMYDMAGGAEIINWARAIISLRASAEEGDFNLVLAKRGRRAGVTRKVPQGTGWTLEPVTTIPLRHAKGRIEIPGIKRGLPLIYWEGREPDEKAQETTKSGRPEKYSFNDYRNVFPERSSHGVPIAELERRLLPNGKIEKKILHNVLKRWAENGDVEIIQVHGQPTRYRATL